MGAGRTSGARFPRLRTRNDATARDRLHARSAGGGAGAARVQNRSAARNPSGSGCSRADASAGLAARRCTPALPQSQTGVPDRRMASVQHGTRVTHRALWCSVCLSECVTEASDARGPHQSPREASAPTRPEGYPTRGCDQAFIGPLTQSGATLGDAACRCAARERCKPETYGAGRGVVVGVAGEERALALLPRC